MKRKHIIYGGVGVIVLVGLIILLIGLLKKDEPTEEALNFCEQYPQALFCTNENATEIEVVSNMFLTLLEGYNRGYSDQFCDAYFTGNLSLYCKESKEIIFPEGFAFLQRTFTVEEKEPDVYNIYTTNTDFSDGYTFRIGINNSTGVYVISGFSYTEPVTLVDLELTDEEINTFMVTMIAASDDDEDTFCETYTTGIAHVECTINLSLIADDVTIIENYTVTQVRTNQFEYTVTNVEETSSVTYDVTFTEIDGNLLISMIDITVN